MQSYTHKSLGDWNDLFDVARTNAFQMMTIKFHTKKSQASNNVYNFTRYTELRGTH